MSIRGDLRVWHQVGYNKNLPSTKIKYLIKRWRTGRRISISISISISRG